MQATRNDLWEMTAEDLMARDIVCLPETTPLRQAVAVLLSRHVEDAPVVDSRGRCVGSLSGSDFVRMSGQRAEPAKPAAPPLPITCSFQTKTHTMDGREVVLCNLESGVCPLQHHCKEPDGADLLVCSQPRCVLMDWQMVDVEKVPTDEVRHFMNPHPVTVRPATPFRVLARTMIDGHVNHVFVVDDLRRPIGIVSSADLLTAIADEAED